MNPVNVERQVRLVAPMDFQLPELGGGGGAGVAAPPVVSELDSTYYDSDELVLARSGITLRHRSGEPGPEWTLKFPVGPSDATLVSRELVFVAPSGSVPAEARDLLRAHLRSRPLHSVGRLRTRRTTVHLLDDEGERLAEVFDDVVSTYEGQRRTGEFHQVEVDATEHGHASHHAMRAAVDRLLDAGCEADPAVPSLIRAIGHRATTPAELTARELGGRPTVEDLIRFRITARVGRIIDLDARVRLDEDPQDIRRFRAAIRGLRADLRLFADRLQPDWARGLRAELAWLETQVSPVRTVDDLRGRLAAMAAAALGPADAVGVAFLMGRLDQQRGHARTHLLGSLRSRRYDHLLDALVVAANHPTLADTSSDGRTGAARPVVAHAVQRTWRQLERAVYSIADEPSDAALTALRIRTRRCRSAVEGIEPIVGRSARRLARALAGFQAVLGAPGDARATEAWLVKAAATDPNCAAVAGKLVAVTRAEAGRTRADWRSSWKSVARVERHSAVTRAVTSGGPA